MLSAGPVFGVSVRARISGAALFGTAALRAIVYVVSFRDDLSRLPVRARSIAPCSRQNCTYSTRLRSLPPTLHPGKPASPAGRSPHGRKARRYGVAAAIRTKAGTPVGVGRRRRQARAVRGSAGFFSQLETAPMPEEQPDGLSGCFLRPATGNALKWKCAHPRSKAKFNLLRRRLIAPLLRWMRGAGASDSQDRPETPSPEARKAWSSRWG